MECLKCQHENPPHSKFCFECGVGLELTCPKCGISLPTGVKFCNECGHDLSQPVAPEKTPAKAPEPSASTGERRQATVLFSDLSGYTAMNEKLDPEEVEGIMSRIKAEAVRIVESHGGIVSQFVGDEVLALFGIPTAHEDDPRRAVRAALELHELARAMSPEVEERIGRPLRMHTGIHSGLIVTSLRDVRDGTVGVTGDTVNTGARLKTLAEDDQILVSSNTQRRVAPFFKMVALAPVELKGKAKSLTPFIVVGESNIDTRLDAAEQRGFTPFTGRERELETLQRCLEKAVAGSGQFVTVVGEAGMGKSRLLHEFRDSLVGDRPNILEGRCRASGANTPYLPLINALRRGLRVNESDSPEVQTKQVMATIREIDSALEEYIPLYLFLLSIPSEDFPLAAKLKGEDLRASINGALGAIVTLYTRQKPMVFILEDWHWADEASETTLKYLLGLVASHPLLLIVTYRPEYGGGWPAQGNHTPVTLQPMQDAAGMGIVKSALGAERLPERLGEMILERTGGNPLFIEELCSDLLEEGVVRTEETEAVLARPTSELSLPDTVQAVIRTRLDRVDTASREVLQWASVIGREFDREVLARAVLSEVTEQLERLMAQDLIRQQRVLPNPVYQFNHVLTQEVVYDTLLLKRRKVLHRQVGQVIEDLHADRLIEHVEALAGHFERGEVWDKAFAYHLQAGLKAKQNHLMKTALHHFDRAKSILETHQPEIPWKLHFDLLFERKESLGEFAQWDKAYQELAVAKKIADREGDRALQVQARFGSATAAFWAGRFPEAIEELAELEELTTDDIDNLLGVAALQTMVFIMAEKNQEALAKERETRELLERAPNSPHAQSALWNLGVFHRWRGDHNNSVQLFERLIKMQKGAVGVENSTRSLVHYCMALVEQGQYEKAIQFMMDLRETALKTDSMYSILRLNNTLGWAYAEIFSLEKAFEYNLMAMNSGEELRGPRHDVLLEIDSFTRLNLADLHLRQGNLDEAESFLNTIYANAQKPDYFLARPRWKARCLIALGELWFKRQEFGKTEKFLAELEAHGLTDHFPFKKHQVRAGRLRAELCSAKGEPESAESEFKTALELAIDLENPTETWKTHQALGNFYTRQSNAKQANSQYRAAWKLVRGIADGLTDPELKEGFIESEPIREVFAKAEQPGKP